MENETDAEHFTNEPLADNFDTGKVELDRLEIIQPRGEALGFTSADKLGSELEELDDGSSLDEGVVDGDGCVAAPGDSYPRSSLPS